MKAKTLLAVLLLSFMNLAALAADGDAKEPVWVAIRVNIAGIGQPASEYYGALEKGDFVGLMNAAAPTGFIKLEHAAYLEDGRVVQLADASDSRVTNYGYQSTVYFRAELILRIIPLDDKFVKQKLLGDK